MNAVLWSVFETVMPVVVLITAPIIAALIIRLFQWLGVRVEAVNRDALQTAISNAALEAVRKAGGPAVATSVTFQDVNAGVEQVLAGVPDAIKRFNVPTAEIAKRVEAQATAIVQSTPAPVVPAAPNPADLLNRILETRR